MKIFKYIINTIIIILLLSNSSFSQKDITLITANQRIEGTDFYFDVFLTAPNDPIYLGNSVLLLNFSNHIFENISETKLNGTCTFVPEDISGSNTQQTRDNYFNLMFVSTIQNEIEIVIQVDQPDNSADFNSTIAKIDNQLYRLGTFKISDLVLPLGLINLKWKESCISCGIYSEVKSIDPIDFSEIPVNVTTENQELIDIESNISLALKIILEGSYNNSVMQNNLKDVIPCVQPYGSNPWGYGGSEEVNRDFIIGNNIVDWILVELRNGDTAEEATEICGIRAGLVNTDGTVLDIDGNPNLKFLGVNPGNYFVVVHHRNHLSIMSDEKIPVLD
ncbi:MAG: hypothetical protein H6611_05435 [Ignavibacteriales bacterium]|nr:hypothetical protein [Ignavibacteriales bacterium]